jgi:hypothetical protein
MRQDRDLGQGMIVRPSSVRDASRDFTIGERSGRQNTDRDGKAGQLQGGQRSTLTEQTRAPGAGTPSSRVVLHLQERPPGLAAVLRPHPAHQLHRVLHQLLQHRESVAHAAGAAGEVHDQRLAPDAGGAA